MSTAGIYGSIIDDRGEQTPCLLIGPNVPRIHYGDGLPVYMVIENDLGIPIQCKDKRLRNLLAYPSSMPAPGDYSPGRWLYADHADLPWSALVPLFDTRVNTSRHTAPRRETISEACHRLAMPLPLKL